MTAAVSAKAAAPTTAAADRRAEQRLARLLRRAGRKAPLPVLQALAAVAVNRGVGGFRRAAAAGAGDAPDAAGRGCPPQDFPPQDLLYRRVARRALRGLTADPTDGALRCHHRRGDPAWARGRIPCAEIGAYLFYQQQGGSDLCADARRS